MPQDQIFQYVLISIDSSPIQEQQFQQFSNAVAEHSLKHDFAQMIHKQDIFIKKFEVKKIEYTGIFVPFQKERFEDLTALNWYLKTLSAKNSLMMFQLVMPDGSIMGM